MYWILVGMVDVKFLLEDNGECAQYEVEPSEIQ